MIIPIFKRYWVVDLPYNHQPTRGIAPHLAMFEPIGRSPRTQAWWSIRNGYLFGRRLRDSVSGTFQKPRSALRCTADETARFGGVQSHGTPKLDGFCERENSTKMDDDRGSPISGNLYLVIETCARFHFNPFRIFSVFDRLPETQRNALETPQSREARKILWIFLSNTIIKQITTSINFRIKSVV